MNLNDIDDEEIDNLIQYKRLVFKLEDELNKKNSENSLLIKLNEDLKALCNNIQNECEEQNKKILSQYSEIKLINKKHEEQIKNINLNFEKQKQIYEDKIKKLSSYNPLSQKEKIEKEIEMRYDEKIKIKDNQIEILNNQIQRIQNENNSLKLEMDDIKLNTKKIKLINDEKNNVINKMNLNMPINEDEEKNNNNYNIIKELQEIINNKEDKISQLRNELNKMQNEKNDYEKVISKKYFFNINELKDLQNQNALLEDELNKKENELNKIYEKLINLQKLGDEQCEIISTLKEEKNNLIIEIENRNKNGDDTEEIQQQLDDLRNLVQKYESDMELNYITNEKIKKQIEEKSISKINQLQKELEEEKNKNKSQIEKNNNTTQIENNNDDNMDNMSQKPERESKIIKFDSDDGNVFKMEYENIKEKYNILVEEQRLLKQKIKKKEEENEYLNKYIKEMIAKKKEKKMNYKELKYKYRNLLNKKEHYKDLCKIAKKNVENIINLLTPQQKQQIEQSENKYLIDTDSFSFTEIY